MKRFLMIALLISAIPAVAVGQTTLVGCSDCNHVASVYMGEGGFIATADGADMVTWVASCGGVTRTGEVAANDDGVVSGLWTGDLACMADGGTFEIGPVMDGGWFWVTDETNSAVGGLVSKDVLDNDAAAITGAGDSVSMTMGKGAVYLKHGASGRVGILPNILPEPPVDPPPPCGATGAGSGTSPFKRLDTGCVMGDGGTITLANYSNAFTGGTTRVMDGDNVTRPATVGGTTTILIDLWGNGSGSIWWDPSTEGTNGVNWVRGNPAVAGTALRAAARYQGVTYTARQGSGPGGSDLTSGAQAGGITFTDAGDSSATVAITADTTYCDDDKNHTQTISVSALVLADTNLGVAQVIPSIKKSATNVAGGISFNVVCAAASSNMGEELVPENPFPTEE